MTMNFVFNRHFARVVLFRIFEDKLISDTKIYLKHIKKKKKLYTKL